MDGFITVILWIGWFFAVGLLSLGATFAMAGAAQTNKTYLKIVAVLPVIALFYLIYFGITSVF